MGMGVECEPIGGAHATLASAREITVFAKWKETQSVRFHSFSVAQDNLFGVYLTSFN